MACENCQCSPSVPVTLKFKKLHQNVPDPKFGTFEAACFDLTYFAEHVNEIVYYTNGQKHKMEFANPDKNILLNHGSTYLLSTGLIFDIPAGYSMRVHARSSLSLKLGLYVANGEGVVDADYTDECFILVTPISRHVRLEHLARVAQAEIVPLIRPVLLQTEENISKRGNRTGGFGSTGS